ncbi:hypothetical protein G7009_22225 [Pseudomonas capeferrum]|uniref:hypothetical protein n=1 Tax=Pseudomonas capeferrum TaxID=1495066 RepID=UPI0015E48776|nr:hypothetical protein [Pseudomonas capeferrum]MBA1204436.1 hypothetical protein [Pseudomonas capeferrum]
MQIIISKEIGRIKFLYEEAEECFAHEILYPEYLSPTDDAVFRVALLARPRNSSTYSVSGVIPNASSVDFFEKTYNCKIDALTDDVSPKGPAKQLADDVYLCFSGGFDSIAARAILPESTKLVSNEFGGAFERESVFFKTFDTNVIQWDLRRTRTNGQPKFNETTDWRFMLAPALLFKHADKPITLATGTILEASPFWYAGQSKPNFQSYSSFGFGPDVSVINPVSCISEYATTLIAAKQLSAESLSDSLDSLAAPASLKRYRKEVLIALAQNSTVPTPRLDMPKHLFGRGLGDDAIALYLVWKLGRDWVLSNYCSNIPSNSRYLDMSFFERIHVNNLNCFHDMDKQAILEKLESFGLSIYSDNDYLNLERSKELRQEFISQAK